MKKSIKVVHNEVTNKVIPIIQHVFGRSSPPRQCDEKKIAKCL